MRVIDHDAGCGAPHVSQRIGEKYLAVETPEGGVALEKQHPRIAQHRRCRLHLSFPAAQFDFVRRSIMLELLARRKIILAGRYWRRVSDAVPPAERRQRGIRQLRTT